MLSFDGSPRLSGNEYQRLHGDRFIRSDPRVVRRIQQELLKSKDRDSCGVDAIVYKKLYSSSKEAYKCLLASALSVPYKPPVWNPIWPVRHRTKPFIKSPDVILDLPDIRNDFCHNLMDWSSTDFLTVAFPSSVYLWHAATSTTLRYPAMYPTCVKWNPGGTEILTAIRLGDIKFTNIQSQEDLPVSGKRCHLDCYVTCAAFHPKQPLLLIGCNKGGTAMYNTQKGLRGIFCCAMYKSAITQAAFSCDGHYYAVTTIDGWIGVYFGLVNCNTLAELKLNGPSRALSWHPWKSSCIVVADTLGYIYVYNVVCSNHLDLVGIYAPTYNSAIVALSFNPLSAELVVSHRISSGLWDDITAMPDFGETQLSVLASLDRVVDRMEGHTGRVHFLSWSPDGTKLATSGTDESARIWNFTQPQKKTAKENSYSKLLDTKAGCLQLGDRFNCTLR